VTLIRRHLVVTESVSCAPAGFFSRGGQIRGLRQKSPAGSRDGARPPETDDGCENNA